MFSSRVHNKYFRADSSYLPSRTLHHTYATTPRSLHSPLSPQSSKDSPVSRASTIPPCLHSLSPSHLSCDPGHLGDESSCACSEDLSTRQCQQPTERKVSGEGEDMPEEHVGLRSAKVAEYLKEVERLDATDDSEDKFVRKTKAGSEGSQGCFPFAASAARGPRSSLGAVLMEYFLPREFWSSSLSPAMPSRRS